LSDSAPVKSTISATAKIVIVLVAVLFVAVLIVGFVARGISPTTGGEGAVVIHDNGEYLQANNEAKNLSTDIFAKIDRGEPLSSFDQEDLKKALRLYEGMLAYIPTKPLPNFTAGQICDSLGDHEAAIKRYQSYLDATANEDSDESRVTRADAHFLIAEACVKTQNYNKALDQANEALKAYPGNVTYLVARADAYTQLGKRKEALDDLSDALTKDPENKRAMVLYHFLNQSHTSGKAKQVAPGDLTKGLFHES
jgi:tetratricopeptide (TPR) repeat protein